MTLSRIKSLLRKNVNLLLLFPTLLAVLVYFLVRNSPQEYKSVTNLSTGLVSRLKLEDTEEKNIDFYSVNSAFDNLINLIKLRSTIEEVSVKILAEQLMQDHPDPRFLTEDDFTFLQKNLPQSVQAKLLGKQQLKNIHEADIIRNICVQMKANNFHLNKVLNSKESPISIITIQGNLDANRIGNSDMIEVTYKGKSSVIAQSMLQLINETFMRRYKTSKTKEAASVVAYFEQQIKESTLLLKQKEDSLEMFSSDNKMIDFAEDGKAISAHQQDIESQVQQESVKLAGAKAALQRLETKLSAKKEVTSNNVLVDQLRDSLAELNSKLTLLEVQANPAEQWAENQSLKKQKAELEKKLKANLTILYNSSHSADGLPSELMLADYINTTLEVDKSQARISSLQAMKGYKANEFRTVMPVGLKLTRLKREVQLAEQNYLGILQNLHASKRREQSINVAANLSILDEPNMPEKPESSKKKLLVAFSFVAGLMLTLGYVLGRGYFDRTIKTPAECEARTQVPFAGALPLADKEEITAILEHRLLNQCINKLRLMSAGRSSPMLLLLFSTQRGDGKSHFGHKLANRLTEMGYATLFYSLAYRDSSAANGFNPLSERKLLESTRLPEVMHGTDGNPDKSESTPSNDIVIVELASITDHSLPVFLIDRANLSLIIVPGHRSWTEADNYTLSIYKSAVKHPVFSIINSIEKTEAKNLLGYSSVRHQEHEPQFKEEEISSAFSED